MIEENIAQSLNTVYEYDLTMNAPDMSQIHNMHDAIIRMFLSYFHIKKGELKKNIWRLEFFTKDWIHWHIEVETAWKLSRKQKKTLDLIVEMACIGE